MFAAYKKEGLLRYWRISGNGRLEHVDDYRWDSNELGVFECFKTRDNSPYIFMFFESYTLQCLEITKDNTLKLNWSSKVSFKNPSTMREEEFCCIKMNYLEKQKILLLGSLGSRIIAYNFETGTKIGDYLPTGPSSDDSDNYIATIAVSDKHSCFITASQTLQTDIVLWRWDEQANILVKIDAKPFRELSRDVMIHQISIFDKDGCVFLKTAENIYIYSMKPDRTLKHITTIDISKVDGYQGFS